MDEVNLTEELVDIAVELDARETSCNCVMSKFDGVGWKDLCDRATEILTKLRG